MGPSTAIDVAKILRGIEQGRFSEPAGRPRREDAIQRVRRHLHHRQRRRRQPGPAAGEPCGARHRRGQLQPAGAQPRLHRAPEDRRSQCQHGPRRHQPLATSRYPCASRGLGTSPTSAWRARSRSCEAVKEIGKNLKSEGGRGRAQGSARWRRRPAEGEAARPPREAVSRSSNRFAAIVARAPADTKLAKIFVAARAFLLHGGAIGLISRVSVRPAAHPIRGAAGYLSTGWGGVPWPTPIPSSNWGWT